MSRWSVSVTGSPFSECVDIEWSTVSGWSPTDGSVVAEVHAKDTSERGLVVTGGDSVAIPSPLHRLIFVQERDSV